MIDRSLTLPRHGAVGHVERVNLSDVGGADGEFLQPKGGVRGVSRFRPLRTGESEAGRDFDRTLHKTLPGWTGQQPACTTEPRSEVRGGNRLIQRGFRGGSELEIRGRPWSSFNLCADDRQLPSFLPAVCLRSALESPEEGPRAGGDKTLHKLRTETNKQGCTSGGTAANSSATAEYRRSHK